MTDKEKRRLTAVMSALIIVGSLANLAFDFFAPPHMWLGASWIGGYAPSVKALCAFVWSFFLSVGLVMASGLLQRTGR
jgi:hypothetical protein